MLRVIGFDADDTLWDNEYLYHQGKRRFQEVLSRYQHPTQSGSRLDEIEIGNIQWYGYGIKSFVLSMIEAAIEISNGEIPADELREIMGVAREMLSADVRLYPDTLPTLRTLQGEYDLMLITKGDSWEQYRKIKRSGVMPYFRYIEIVPDKTEETYRHLLEKLDIAPDEFVMVGNSLRSDIVPVVKLGAQAVYIPRESTWAHEHVDEEGRKGVDYHQLDALAQLPAWLKENS